MSRLTVFQRKQSALYALKLLYSVKAALQGFFPDIYTGLTPGLRQLYTGLTPALHRLYTGFTPHRRSTRRRTSTG